MENHTIKNIKRLGLIGILAGSLAFNSGCTRAEKTLTGGVVLGPLGAVGGYVIGGEDKKEEKLNQQFIDINNDGILDLVYNNEVCYGKYIDVNGDGILDLVYTRENKGGLKIKGFRGIIEKYVCYGKKDGTFSEPIKVDVK